MAQVVVSVRDVAGTTTSQTVTVNVQAPPIGGLYPAPGSVGAMGQPSPSSRWFTESAGQLIQNEILEFLEVRHSNVTVRNCVIHNAGPYVVNFKNGTNPTGLLLENCDLIGQGNNSSAAFPPVAPVTVRRCDVWGSVDGLKLGDNSTCEDSWVHDLRIPAGAHADGLQIQHGSNITIRRTRFDMDTDAGANACVMASTNPNPVSNLVMEDNWFGGGNYAVSVRQQGPTKPTTVRLLRNTFKRGAFRFGEWNIPLSDVVDFVHSGNRYDDGVALD